MDKTIVCATCKIVNTEKKHVRKRQIKEKKYGKRRRKVDWLLG
jgi:hypothetical protein